MTGFFRFLLNHNTLPTLLTCSLLFFITSCGDKVTANSSIDKYMEIINLAKEQVQKTRELQFTRPVQIGLLSRKQYSKYNEQWSSGNSALIMREFKQIGFIPDKFNDSNFLSSNDDNFAAAFYVPGTDSLYIIDADQTSEDELFYYLCHELTHALQEQHFNAHSNSIYPDVNGSTLNSDFYISQKCISEGDASLSALFSYFTLVVGSKLIDTVGNIYKSDIDNYYDTLPMYPDPRYLSISGIAPYTLGSWYVFNIYKEGDWEDVNMLYHAQRINSTADVINATNILPFAFDFSHITPIMRKNTRKLILADDDTYGPVMLMALLNEQVDSAHCKKALGWQGDRLVYTLSDDQTYGSFVWAMKFATTEDALYITDKLDKFLSGQKLSEIASTRVADTNGVTYKSIYASTLLKRHENTVLWLENVPQQDSVVTLLTRSALARRNVFEINFSTISANDKSKFLDKFLGGNSKRYQHKINF